MLPTLAHRTLLRGLAGLWLAGATSCTGWTSSGSPPGRDVVDELKPARAGTYRLMGSAEDSRVGGPRQVTETYVVEPSYRRGRGQRQRTSLDDGSGTARSWDTEYRPTGAFRLRETAGLARWDWAPPLRSVATPLKVGAEWSSSATATIPDVAGIRRELGVRSRSRVTGTDTVAVGGTRMLTYVIEGTVTTTVKDTVRATGDTTTLTTTATGRSWFAPSRGLAVRTEVRTEVTGGAEGAGYTVVRRLRAERL